MAGLDLARWQGAALSRALAAGLLVLLTGCAVPPATPPGTPAPQPLSALAPSQELVAEPVAKVELPSVPERLTALAKRLLAKLKKQAPAPAAAVEAEPQPKPESEVNEKYRLTGEAALELERGRASWYGGRFHGQRTASGEPYDKYALTAAHKTLPFGTIVRVRSLKLGREVDVRINDRGPFAPGRVIDVSQAAAEALGLTSAGVADVSLNLAESNLAESNVLQAEERQPRRKAASAKAKAGKDKGQASKDKASKDKARSKDKRVGAKAKPQASKPR
jgi:rare lipoprotein A